MTAPDWLVRAISLNSNGSSISFSLELETTQGTSSEAIVSVLNVCNDIDQEGICLATDSLVKRCIKQQIWPNNKFLTEQSVKNVKITDKTNKKTIINVLLNFTRKNHLNDLHRLRFWKQYSIVVQKEINSMKTICTQGIKLEMMKCKKYK